MTHFRVNSNCNFCGMAIEFSGLDWGVATDLKTDDILYVYHTECLEESDEA